MTDSYGKFIARLEISRNVKKGDEKFVMGQFFFMFFLTLIMAVFLFWTDHSIISVVVSSIFFIFSVSFFYLAISLSCTELAIYEHGIEEEYSYYGLGKILRKKTKRFIPWKDIVMIYPNSEKYHYSIIHVRSNKNIFVKKECFNDVLEIFNSLERGLPVELERSMDMHGEIEVIKNKDIENLVRKDYGKFQITKRTRYLDDDIVIPIRRIDALRILKVQFIVVGFVIIIFSIIFFLISGNIIVTIGLLPLILIIFSLSFIKRIYWIPKNVRVTPNYLGLDFKTGRYKWISWNDVNLTKTICNTNQRYIYKDSFHIHAIVSSNVTDYLRENSYKFVRE